MTTTPVYSTGPGMDYDPGCDDDCTCDEPTPVRVVFPTPTPQFLGETIIFFIFHTLLAALLLWIVAVVTIPWAGITYWVTLLLVFAYRFITHKRLGLGYMGSR